MITLRSITYFLAIVITTAVFGLLIITIGMLLPLSARDRLSQVWGKLNLWLMRVICRLKYRIHGEENLPKQSVIVMSKHQSSWETIALKGLLMANQSWVLKHELKKIPIFGWALASVPTIAIDRSAGRKAVKQIVEQGTSLLNRGRLIVIFPEGTRTAPGQKKKYGIGGGMLAEKSGFPIVPIAHNAGIFWSRRAMKKYPGTIDMVVGKPIESNGKNAAEITREVEQWIEGEVAKLPSSRQPAD